jgi:hypothetical protein
MGPAEGGQRFTLDSACPGHDHPERGRRQDVGRPVQLLGQRTLREQRPDDDVRRPGCSGDGLGEERGGALSSGTSSSSTTVSAGTCRSVS